MVQSLTSAKSKFLSLVGTAMPASLRMEGWLREPRASRGPSGCPAGRDVTWEP